MMSESTSDGGEDFKSQTKYKQFSSAVERALKAFELSTEWHDLISSLARLNKVLLAYMQYTVVPHQPTVCKRLTQCLHPNLPSGVHIKTLDVYRAIFDRIGPSGLSNGLLAYSSGLFPLISYASMAVRTQLLEIYEKYYIPLGDGLTPGLHGMVHGLLPGLEDESEHTDRINRLLETVCEMTDLTLYFSALWQCVHSSPDVRLSAANVILTKLNKKLSAEDQVYLLGGNLPLVVSAICAGLIDKNVLTNRSLLDILTILFPLHRPFLLPSDCSTIMVAALETLLKRDLSLNRRLFSWLLGSQVNTSSLATLDRSSSVSKEVVYFETYSKDFVESALSCLCAQAVVAVKRPSASKLDCVQPYRLLRMLVDRAEISDSLISDVLLDILSCLKQQVDALGGLTTTQAQDVGMLKLRKSHSDDLPRKLGRKGALKVEILQSANLFFNVLSDGVLWQWLASLLESTLHPDRLKSESQMEAGKNEDNESTPSNGYERAISPIDSAPLSPMLTIFDPSPRSMPTLSLPAKEQTTCSHLIGLTKFLLQSLPLDSIEHAHLLHLPQLSLTVVTCLMKAHSLLTASEIQLTLDLISFIIDELMRSPSSCASTPSTLATPTQTRRHENTVTTIPFSALSDQTAESADTPSIEKLTHDIVECCLEFFVGFVRERVLESTSDRQSFSEACQLLVLLATFGANKDSRNLHGLNSHGWVDGLVASCTLNWRSHDHRVTFVAIETLLLLLRMHSQQLNSTGFPGVDFDGPPLSRDLITQPVVNYMTDNPNLGRSLTECLWNCLSQSHPSCHVEAPVLLSWLHVQLSPSNVCETVILEHFTRDGLEAYHCFATLWRHSTPTSSGRSFNRAILRMLEGLKSDSPSVRMFVQSWVMFSLSRNGDIQRLLQPLVRILLIPTHFRRPALELESEHLGIGMRLSPEDTAKDPAYAKYYYASLGIADPLDTSKRGQYRESLFHYNQIFDTQQVLYALSLLQCVIDIDPLTVVSCMSGSVVEPSVYSGSQPSSREERTGGEESHSQKSLLELALSLCVDLLRSEYPANVEASLNNHLDNVLVKLSSVELVCSFLIHLSTLLGSNVSEGELSSTAAGGTVNSASFVSALITLCDVQKITLLSLGQVIQDLRDFGTNKDVDNLKHSEREVIVQALFTHLLMLVQGLVALETQCHSKQTTTTTQPSSLGTSGLKSSNNEWLPAVLTSLPTMSQPFFQSLLLDLLSDATLTHLHETLLCLFTAVLPNLLNQQLYEITPKVLKQICKNLERKEKDCQHKDRLTCLYLGSLCSIIAWCLYGETTSDGLHTITPYWRRLRVTESEERPDTLSPSSAQPSTMSWLFSVFSTSGQINKSLGSNEGGSKVTSFSRSRVGVNSRVGQYTMMLLPAVYNAITEVWRGRSQGSEVTEGRCFLFGMEHGEDDATRTQQKRDIFHLTAQLVSTLANREPTAFFSSVSHVWMEWNLEGKVQSSRRLVKKKETFIDLLHKIEVLPLPAMIDCVQTTLTEIRMGEERDSGFLRQKYLLHFLYKYISSTQQSSEELAYCSGQVVTFLREFFNLTFSNTPDYLINNCHILCMLTSILHVVVCRVPAPEPKKQKKERKDLQDLIHKLCESLSLAANVGLSQNDFVLINDSHVTSNDDHVIPTDSHVTQTVELTSDNPTPHDQDLSKRTADKSSSKPSVRVGTNRVDSPVHVSQHKQEWTTDHHSDSEVVAQRRHTNITAARVNKHGVKVHSGTDQSTVIDLKLPTVQALAVLSNVLSHFVDCAYEGSEKDKVIALLKAVMYNVWPHLQTHSSETQQSYAHAVKLLSSLSGFQVSRKAWRKEALELFLSPSFFKMWACHLRDWMVVVDNLMTQDHVTFKDLLSRLHLTNTTGVVNIFVSIEQEMVNGARLLKRMAFTILSAETDQFVEFLPDIQENLSEYLKVLSHPVICEVVMLAFRVLLLRFSPPHLMAFWPAITSEMSTLLTDLDNDLNADSSSLSKDKLHLHLCVCKLLDTVMALPAQHLPHFQLLRWGFSNHGAYSSSEAYVVTKLCKRFHALGSPTLDALRSHYTPQTTPPYLQSTTITSLRELKPLFTALSHPAGRTVNQLPTGGGSHFSLMEQQNKRLKLIEDILLQDFVD